MEEQLEGKGVRGQDVQEMEEREDTSSGAGAPPSPQGEGLGGAQGEGVDQGDAKEKVKDEIMQTVEELQDLIMSGIVELVEPMKSRGQEVKELAYDFSQLKAGSVLQMLDKYMGESAVTFNEAQKLAVFALACRGCEENMGLDEYDIMDRIGGEDAAACALHGGQFLAMKYAAMQRTVKEKEKGSILLEGTLTLEKPIERRDKEENITETISELRYNFRRIVGSKYVEVVGATARTPAGITCKAGIGLFVEAVRTCQPLSAAEAQQFTVQDAITAALVGMGFFLRSRSQVAKRTKKRRRT